ncbi:uncharacterized protein L969DRAFT_91230 [Mixia osmundae IAM 14324]|nr:uncharacterized protein L969DRAFT_91230 [Mixia osmundae IAM 14324]KEI36133.1 hypothetical protein L969DRAFT_91230 [Mixia osmundae IAM 14324]
MRPGAGQRPLRLGQRRAIYVPVQTRLSHSSNALHRSATRYPSRRPLPSVLIPPAASARRHASTSIFSQPWAFWNRAEVSDADARLHDLARKAGEAPHDVDVQTAYLNELAAKPDSADRRSKLVLHYESLTGLFDQAKSTPLQRTLLTNTVIWADYKTALQAQLGPTQATDAIATVGAKRVGRLAVTDDASASKPAEESTAPGMTYADPSLLVNMPAPSVPLASSVVGGSAASTVPSPQAANVQATTSSSHPRAELAKTVASHLQSGKPMTEYAGSAALLGAKSTGATQETIKIIVETRTPEQTWSESLYAGFLWIIKQLFIVLLFVYIGFYCIGAIMQSSASLLKKAGNVNAIEFKAAPSQQPTKFKDVHGAEEAKEELEEFVQFLRDPSRFAKLGGRLPKGILLTGPPGTGKTLLARAIAGEAGSNFLVASGSDFDLAYVGVGAAKVRQLFAEARKNAPCIIFLDELDALGSKRSGGDPAANRQTLNALLVEMDGFSPAEGVLVVAATNLPNVLDPALIRPGRFDRSIAVPLPDAIGRREILQHHLGNVIYDRTVDVAALARGTTGFSGAALAALVNQAAVKASKEGKSAVQQADLSWAITRKLMGAERKSGRLYDQAMKEATAVHEAGHALMSILTKGAVPLYQVTIMPRGESLGHTSFLHESDEKTYNMSCQELKAKMDVAFGGRIAEELVYGKENISTGASSDILQASQVASHMVKSWGFSDAVGPVAYEPRDYETLAPDTKALIETEIRELVVSAEARARDLLLQNREKLDRLTQALVKYETLDSKEVQAVIKGLPISRSAP